MTRKSHFSTTTNGGCCLTLVSFHWNLMVASRLIVCASSSIPRMLLRFQLALVIIVNIIVVVIIVLIVIYMYLI